MEKKYIAAFTIENNHAESMKVSHLVIGHSRVEEFYREYSSLPENERAFLVNDIFMYEDVMVALVDHMDAIVRCKSESPVVEDTEVDNSPRVIGKIELPEDSISSDNEYDCELCGCETGSSRWGDTRHILSVRDEVYGTWRQEKICDNCYYAHVESSLNIN